MTKLKNWIVQIYLFLMLGIFPLYYQNKYFNMGDAKYDFFKYAALGLCAALAITILFDRKNEKPGTISMQDAAVLAYLVFAAVSWILSPYRADGWIGSVEWYMGLFSQLMFGVIYFAVSRYGSKKRWLLWVIGISGVVVFLLSYLHRFDIDPLGFYAGVPEKKKTAFLGTIGNATWYSSYVSIILTFVTAFYLFVGKRDSFVKKLEHIFVGFLIFMGFATSVTQNSDSIYFGLGFGFIFFLWFALENAVVWRRYLEVLLIGVSAVKITGLLQMRFPERVPDLDAISIMLTQGNFTWAVLGILLVIYGATRYLENRCTEEFWKKIKFRSKVRVFRKIIFGIMILGVLSIPVIIWLFTTGRASVDSGILYDSGYLIFDNKWGNSRGKNWKYAVRIFQEFPLQMKLFGCGPDSMCFYSAEFHQAEIQKMWKNVIVTNAHNEWLTALINYGIAGASAYIVIFIAALRNVVKYWKKQPVLIGVGAAVLAYMGHNFFCYQQVVCTPIIFIFIGLAEYWCRRMKS